MSDRISGYMPKECQNICQLVGIARWKTCFPTCQVRVSRFYQSYQTDISQWALQDLNCELQISVCTAGPQLQAPDLSGHCRISTASSRSQWALPGLNRELQISVGTAGSQPRAPDLSGRCRTSTVSSRSQWALPDLNRELQISVGTSGLQPDAGENTK